jgi:UDP-N-acetyl-D-galactosamine dehydrogenase
MSKFVAEKTVKKLIESDINVKCSTVLVMGLTFKENVPDLRNSKVAEVINELKEYGINVRVTDPIADSLESKQEYGIKLEDLENISNVDAIIVAVNHTEYLDFQLDDLKKYYNIAIDNPVLIDVKSIFKKEEAEKNYNYWRM